MLTLVRPSVSLEADSIVERLEDMVVAHEIRCLEDVGICLIESGKEIRGKEPIHRFLSILEQEMAFSNSLSADACFLDPNSGEVC